MSGHGRHILITGAGGFVGSRLAARLLTEPDFADARLTLTDMRKPDAPVHERVRAVAADIAKPGDIDLLLDGGVDIVYHLAGIMGGAAETDYPLSRRVNIDATLDLFERLRDEKRPPRLVFASSIAVFGPPLPDLIDDDTLPLPTMNYGAQKRMMEVVLEQFSGRGWIDGLALRLPGIVARAGAVARLKSAFLNTMFYDYRDGRDISLPVSPDGTTWLISVQACVDAFVHAGRVPAEALGARRAFTLPAQRVTMEGLVAALAARFPGSPTTVTWHPDPALEKQFARQPALETALGDALGFLHDGTIDRLVERALAPLDT